ncbi:hypothetical protein C2845_PM18G05920 [Panicum miliaceum]|uniref:Uncharacterized protein n=1 Tax=Panicum miliaceum TaxID=4540 RepID=A0A3L6PJG8_PANMI|nr:hypothetical protein C2845_PM18G05920 [Panicum miliaceum]
MIDQRSRYNPDHVRVKIACRDVKAIPKSVESTLGVFIYDFFFELDDQEFLNGNKQKSTVKVSEPEMQPNPKKQRKEQGTGP